MRTFLKTTETSEVTNYPYGRLQCVAKFGIEFKQKKGFRSTFQTVNPKTGRVNAVKNSTYYPVLVQYKDSETGHIKSISHHFNGSKEINEGCKFMNENFSLFTDEQIKHIYTHILSMLLVNAKALVIYCNSNFEDIKPLINEAIEVCKQGMKTGENLFYKINLNIEALEKTKVPNYNPFTIRQYEII
jgi:hypothetical protein